MSDYLKAKDIFTQRRNFNNEGFEEYPLIVQPSSVLSTDATSNLTLTPLSESNVPSASYALTASFALNGEGGGSGSVESASWASASLSASYAPFVLGITGDNLLASNVSGSIVAASTTIVYNITASRAVSASWAPSSVAMTGSYLPLGGGTLTGSLIISAPPVPLSIVTMTNNVPSMTLTNNYPSYPAEFDIYNSVGERGVIEVLDDGFPFISGSMVVGHATGVGNTYVWNNTTNPDPAIWFANNAVGISDNQMRIVPGGVRVTGSIVATTNISSDGANFNQISFNPSVLTPLGDTASIDFSGKTYRTMTITGSTFITGSNYATGRMVNVKVYASTGDSPLFFSPNWIFVGNPAPVSMSVNKTGIFSFTCYGSTDLDVVAANAVQA